MHEVDEMPFVLHLLQPDEHFLDVGANVGSYSVPAGGLASQCDSPETGVDKISPRFLIGANRLRSRQSTFKTNGS